MTGSVWPAVGWAAAWAAIGCAAWAAAALALARAVHRYNIVDTLWGLGFVLIAIIEAAAGIGLGAGDPVRRGLILACVLAWGARLSWHVGRRSAGKGEDPRYADLLGKGAGPPALRAALLIFAPQALTLFVVSLPVQAGMVEPGAVSWLGWLGVAIWLAGFCFEAIGDAQMRRFKSDPAHRGAVADTGLWRYTRHPNYFGDAVVWTGIFIIAAERWPGVLTIAGPVLMTYLLAFGTGKRLLERSMRNRPGYRAYMRRTSGFVPLPHWLYRRLTGNPG
jgi:steroid 5-alpha reductase family enzyme